MTALRTVMLLAAAAVLEAGGDALIRRGLQDRVFLLLGAITLFAYGVMVNLSGLDFGRAIGGYVAMFFVTSQVIAVLIFHAPISWRMFVGGTLIVAGGCVLIL